MLLAVDIGNSFIKFAVYDEAVRHHQFSIPTQRDRSLQLDLHRRSSHEFESLVSTAVVCSVVPESSEALLEFLQERRIPATVVSSGLDIGFRVVQRPRATLGSDRFVNAFAAAVKYGAPVIVCSFGTATTIDVIDKHKTLLGGIIAPGLRTSARSLHDSTAQLPEVPIEIPEKLIGDTTASALLSGVVFGHVEMVEGLLLRIKHEFRIDPRVVATGGFSEIFATLSKSALVVDEHLTLEGLRLINERLLSTSRNIDEA